MHESTVSRVTNEKFVQTPRGVLPLKFFFSSGLSTTGGEDVSRARHQGADPEARGGRGSEASAHRPGDREHPARRAASRSRGAPWRSTATSSACCRRACASGYERGDASCRRCALRPARHSGDRPCTVRASTSRRLRARSREGRGREPAAVHGAGGGRVRADRRTSVRGHRHRRRLRRRHVAACSQRARGRSTPFLRVVRHRVAPRHRRRAAHRLSARARRRARLLSGRSAVQARGHPATRRADPRRRSGHGHGLQAGEVREGVRLRRSTTA